MHFIKKLPFLLLPVLFAVPVQIAKAQLYPNCTNYPPTTYDEYFCDCSASSLWEGVEQIQREYNSFGGLMQGWYEFESNVNFLNNRIGVWGPGDTHDTLEEVLAQYNGELVFENSDFSCTWKLKNSGGGGGDGGDGGDDDDTEW
jgi:hypothetical protein